MQIEYCYEEEEKKKTALTWLNAAVASKVIYFVVNECATMPRHNFGGGFEKRQLLLLLFEHNQPHVSKLIRSCPEWL